MSTGASTAVNGEWMNVSGYESALSHLLFPNRIRAACGSASFRATTTVRRLGCVSMIKAHANAAFEMETLIPRRRGDNFFVLALQLSGEASYRHTHGGVRTRPEVLVFMNSRNVMNTAQFGPADALVVKMPCSLIRRHAPDIDDCSWATADATSGSAKILRDFLLDLWDYGAGLQGRDHEMLPLTLLTLSDCVFHFGKGGVRSNGTEQDRILHRLRDEIAARLHQDSLDVQQLARAVGVSRSKLYNVTGQAGTTVEQLIIGMRLDWAARALADRSLADVSITDIAFEAGFSDLPHFTRRFKRKFSVTPSEYRASNRD